VPQKLVGNGVVSIRHAPLADQIPVAAGAMTDQTPEKVRVCLVEHVDPAAKARTRVCSNIGTSQNVQVSEILLLNLNSFYVIYYCFY